MYRERCKAAIHALDAGTSSLHKIHHMNRVIHRDGVRPGKCIADCVDKFAAVQSGALYFTVFCFFHRSGLADDIVVHPFGITVPLNIFHTVVEVDRTRQSIHAKAAPIP